MFLAALIVYGTTFIGFGCLFAFLIYVIFEAEIQRFIDRRRARAFFKRINSRYSYRIDKALDEGKEDLLYYKGW